MEMLKRLLSWLDRTVRFITGCALIGWAKRFVSWLSEIQSFTEPPSWAPEAMKWLWSSDFWTFILVLCGIGLIVWNERHTNALIRSEKDDQLEALLAEQKKLHEAIAVHFFYDQKMSAFERAHRALGQAWRQATEALKKVDVSFMGMAMDGERKTACNLYFDASTALRVAISDVGFRWDDPKLTEQQQIAAGVNDYPDVLKQAYRTMWERKVSDELLLETFSRQSPVPSLLRQAQNRVIRIATEISQHEASKTKQVVNA